MSLRGQAVKAVGWTSGAKVVQQIFQLGLSIALMRLLGPEAFGLISMILVFSGFAAIFSEMGFGSALVQKQDLREEHCHTIFWVNTGIGAIFALFFHLFAPFVADFYSEPQLNSMTSWIALTFVFSSFGIVPRALLQKELRFDVLAKVNIGALVISGIVSVVMAGLDAGVWSLVVQQILNQGLVSVMLLRLGSWRPGFIWSWKAFKEMFRYGLGLTGFNVVNYWARSADKLLIGKFIGTEALGLYSRAYSLMLLPISQIISVLAPVMFPVFSSIQKDKDRTKSAFLRVLQFLTFITFPMMFGLVVVAEPFVLGILGADWISIIPLVQVLSLVGVIQTMCNPTGWIYKSQGKTDWMFWWGVGGSGFLILSIIVGIMLGGVEGVAKAYLVGNIIITLPCIAIPGRLIGMTLGDFFGAVKISLGCAIGMTVCVWLVGNFVIPAGLLPLVELMILVVIGVISYLIFALAFRHPALKEIEVEFSRIWAIRKKAFS